MLGSGLSSLTSLHLINPSCCGPRNIALTWTLPNLRDLVLATTQIPETITDDPDTDTSSDPSSTSNFFARHPLIERLYIEYTENDFDLSPNVLPNLRALSVPHDFTWTNSSIFSHLNHRPISLLQMNNWPFLTTDTIITRVPHLAHSLRCLAMVGFIDAFRTNIPHIPALLQSLPLLIELSIHVESSGPLSDKPEPVGIDDLVSILLVTRIQHSLHLA